MAFAFALALMLPHCAMVDERNAEVFVDPGKIVVLSCAEIVLKLKKVVPEERKLKGLIDRASINQSGAFVSAFAYKPDYLQALGQRRLLVEEARKKDCTLPPELQIDPVTGQLAPTPTQISPR